MDDFKIMVRLMAAIKASEESPVFDVALVDECVLKTTAAQRDILAVKLQKSGYIEGLVVIDDIDNQTVPFVVWNRSKPSITIAGMEWMRNSSAFQKAVKEVQDAEITLAAKAISNVIYGM